MFHRRLDWPINKKKLKERHHKSLSIVSHFFCVCASKVHISFPCQPLKGLNGINQIRISHRCIGVSKWNERTKKKWIESKIYRSQWVRNMLLKYFGNDPNPSAQTNRHTQTKFNKRNKRLLKNRKDFLLKIKRTLPFLLSLSLSVSGVFIQKGEERRVCVSLFIL